MNQKRVAHVEVVACTFSRSAGCDFNMGHQEPIVC